MKERQKTSISMQPVSKQEKNNKKVAGGYLTYYTPVTC